MSKPRKQSRWAVFGVVHPHAEPYVADFFASLAAQQDPGFEVFLLNDGCKHFKVPEAGAGLTVHVREASGPVSAIRKDGVRWIAGQGVGDIVFADTDDTFAPDRIGVCKRLLRDEAVVFNELAWMDGAHEPDDVLGRRFADGDRIGVERILDANCLGLTHTALRSTDAAAACEKISDAEPVFDWAFFTRVLSTGLRACFTSKTRTFYRLLPEGHAPVNYLKDAQAVLRAVRLKRDHYAGCADLGPMYRDRQEQFRRLEERLSSDSGLLERYLQAARDRCPAQPLWWEPIKTEKELGL